jgi:hypothetical protein
VNVKHKKKSIRTSSMASSSPAASPDTFRFKFLFANFDGVQVLCSYSSDSTGLQIKQDLLDKHWPTTQVDKPLNSGCMRLLCMGKMIEDGKMLKDCKLPSFPDHPTPVNISLLAKDRGMYSEAGKRPLVSNGEKEAPALATSANAATTGAAAAGTNRPPSSPSCCTVQ